MDFKLNAKFSFFLLALLLSINFVHCYLEDKETINLQDSGTFIISSDDDDYDDYEIENEIIQPKDIEDIGTLAEDEEKFIAHHIYVAKYNGPVPRAENKFSKDFSDLLQTVIRKRSLKLRNKQQVDDEYEIVDYNGDEEMLEEKEVFSTTKKDKDALKDDSLNEDQTSTMSSTAEPDFYETEIASEKFEITPFSSMVSSVNEPHSSDTITYDEKITSTTLESTESTFKWMNSTNISSTDALRSTQETVINTEFKTELKTLPMTKTTPIYENTEESNIYFTKKKGKVLEELIEKTTKSLDYEKIMPEYSFEIGEIKTGNFTYNFTNNVIEKSVKDLMKQATNIKKPRNCSAFHGFKYGIQAFICAIDGFKKSKNVDEIKMTAGKTWKIVRVWLFIYICIVIPLWCQKGWCCCCCRCKFCFPRRIIIKEKKYFSQNPPGIMLKTTVKDKQETPTKRLHYEPTIFEEDVYEQFERAIKNL